MATTLVAPSPVSVERTLLVQVLASASGCPSLLHLSADLQDQEAHFCKQLAHTPA